MYTFSGRERVNQIFFMYTHRGEETGYARPRYFVNL